MTIDQFNNTRWGAGMKVLCKPMGVKYEPYMADVVSVDFSQCLIGIPDMVGTEVRWLRCENCEIINPEKEER